MKDCSVVVITGASSGIGLACAKYFCAKGCKVYGLSRRIVDDCFTSLQCDVTNSAKVAEALREIYDREGRIDCFVNNAGMGISGAAECIPQEETDKLLSLNLNAAMECARLAVPYLKQSKGKLINTSSVAAIIPIPFQTAYSASKAAINLFSMALGLELKPFGVHVSAVMPGDTRTGFTDARVKFQNESYGQRLTKSVERMEKDERGGKNPESVAKVMYKIFRRKNPPPLVTVGFSYKCVAFLRRILPNRLMSWIVEKLYG